MSLRPASWQVFGISASRRAAMGNAAAATTERSPRRSPNSSRPNLRVLQGGNAPRLERLTPRIRLLGLVGMVGVVLFGVVAFQVVLSQGQFRLEKVQVKANQEQAQYERLRLRVAELESPARITSEAQNRLGMVTPDKVTPVTPKASDLPTEGTVSQAGPASPPTTTDAGAWSTVKPHLSSTTK